MAVSEVCQFALNGMFFSAGLFALGTIIMTCRAAIPAIAALRHDLAQMNGDQGCQRELRFRLMTTEVKLEQPRLRVVAIRTPAVPVPVGPLDGLRAAA